MRRLLSTLLIALAFMHSAEAGVASARESSGSIRQEQIVDSAGSLSFHLSDSSSHPQDCGDESCPQHVCHVGHCALLVTTAVEITTSLDIRLLEPESLVVPPATTRTGPHRPPRA